MKQLFIALVGRNASGKTTVAKRLTEDFPVLNRVNADDFRDFVAHQVAYFNALDRSYKNPLYDQLNPLAMTYRTMLTSVLLKAGQHVLYDGSGAKREYRDTYLANVRETAPDCLTVIIYMHIEEAELLPRLEERKGAGGDRWQEMYWDSAKEGFEPPEPDEADKLLRYDQNNYDEIKQAIAELL